MKLPSPQEFLDKLAASPAAAAAFDRATQRERPGKSRREAVAACHALAVATFTEIEANKRKLIAARQKIAALEQAKLTNQRLRASLAATKALVASRPRKLETAAAKFSRLQKTDPRRAAAFYQENRLEILRSIN
jgi:sugar diacid utilization regulator